MHRFFSAAALVPATALLIAPSMAQAAEPVCLTRHEATALISYALPQAIDGIAKRCDPVLPADAFLPRHGAELVARYAAQKDQYWPDAKPALLKALGGQGTGKLAASMPDENLRQLADVFVEGFVSQRIAPKSCDQLDGAIGLMAPLPPENTARLIALAVEAAGNADPKLGNVSLCPRAPRQ